MIPVERVTWIQNRSNRRNDEKGTPESLRFGFWECLCEIRHRLHGRKRSDSAAPSKSSFRSPIVPENVLIQISSPRVLILRINKVKRTDMGHLIQPVIRCQSRAGVVDLHRTGDVLSPHSRRTSRQGLQGSERSSRSVPRSRHRLPCLQSQGACGSPLPWRGPAGCDRCEMAGLPKPLDRLHRAVRDVYCVPDVPNARVPSMSKNTYLLSALVSSIAVSFRLPFLFPCLRGENGTYKNARNCCFYVLFRWIMSIYGSMQHL